MTILEKAPCLVEGFSKICDMNHLKEKRMKAVSILPFEKHGLPVCQFLLLIG